MNRFDAMIADIAARVDGGTVPQPVPYTMRAVEEYRSLRIHSAPVLAALAIDPAEDGAGALLLALDDIGMRTASIIAEPRMKVQPDKAARDARLNRITMHMAPQWRQALASTRDFPEPERGLPAMIVPVAAQFLGDGTIGDRHGASGGALLSLHQGDGEGEIADLIAIPLERGRVLSLTGYTAAIGSFAPDAKGRLVVFGNGVAWLRAWLANIRRTTADTPEHLVRRLHMPFAPPPGLLAVEPAAIDWCTASPTCHLPDTVSEILCADSPKLAAYIEARAKSRPRPAPAVRCATVIREAA